MAFNLHGSSVVVAFFVFSPPPLLFCAKKLGYSVKFAIPLLTLFFAHASPFPIFPAREVTARPSTFSSPPPFFRDEICQTGVRPLSHLKGERGLSVTRLWGCIKRRVWMKLNREEKCFVEAYYYSSRSRLSVPILSGGKKHGWATSSEEKKGLRLFSLYGRKSR